MPWEDRSILSQRKQFVQLAHKPGTNFRQLCRRFAICPTTGYKWCHRTAQDGDIGLQNRSRRPHASPWRTPEAMEHLILALRQDHHDWGGRKIQDVLVKAGYQGVPSPSTITEVLRRHGRLDPNEAAKHRPFTRFEHDAPNDLWQMDFKGHFAMTQGRCHPLTILDDHSRYAIAVQACENEQETTVRAALIDRFRLYGLPWRMLMDNGSPWSGQGQGITALEAWLMRLDIGVSHGRPYHPQTQGKDERFHRTLKSAVLHSSVLSRYPLTDLWHCQQSFDAFRETYNHVRPHEALNMKRPAQHYRVSDRCYPEVLPAIEYWPGDKVRKVSVPGRISLSGYTISVGDGLNGQFVAARPTEIDGVYDLVYCQNIIKRIDLRDYEKPY
jgi:transposase InsO family protein